MIAKSLLHICSSAWITLPRWMITGLLDAVGTPLGTVQALLGHSSSEITRGTYIHSVPADARQAVEGVEKLFETSGKLIGPKWTQIPEWPEMGSSLIN